MGNERVNNLLNTTLAGKITKKIAEKENKQTKPTDVIVADKWNKFIGKIKTGKTINNHITLENAMNSITRYAVVESKKQNKSANDIAKEWYNLLGLELTAKQTETTQTPAPIPVDEKAEPVQAPQVQTPALELEDCIVARVHNEYAPDTKTLLKSTYYAPDKDVVTAVEEFCPETGNIEKSTNYREDGSVEFVNEHDSEGKWITQTGYRENGTIEYVNEYNPEKIGQKLSTSYYREDGQSVEYKEEFSQETGNVVKSTDYRPDGSVLFINDSNDEGQWLRQTGFREDNTIEYINEYDPENHGEIVFTTHYKEDGQTVDYVD